MQLLNIAVQKPVVTWSACLLSRQPWRTLRKRSKATSRSSVTEKRSALFGLFIPFQFAPCELLFPTQQVTEDYHSQPYHPSVHSLANFSPKQAPSIRNFPRGLLLLSFSLSCLPHGLAQASHALLSGISRFRAQGLQLLSAPPSRLLLARPAQRRTVAGRMAEVTVLRDGPRLHAPLLSTLYYVGALFSALEPFLIPELQRATGPRSLT